MAMDLLPLIESPPEDEAEEISTPEGSDDEENREKANAPHKRTSGKLLEKDFCRDKFTVLNNFIFFIIKCKHNYQTF